MTYSELKRYLKKNSCLFESEGSRHESWYSPHTGERFPVGRHNSEQVPPGTLKSILTAAGLPKL